MWWRSCVAALLLCCCCAAVRELRTADDGGGGLAALTAGEAKETRFVLGSRYGRSAPAPRFMSPRNDRFFMSSRYGKRSGASGARGDRPYRVLLLDLLSPERYTSRHGRPEPGSASLAG